MLLGGSGQKASIRVSGKDYPAVVFKMESGEFLCFRYPTLVNGSDVTFCDDAPRVQVPNTFAGGIQTEAEQLATVENHKKELGRNRYRCLYCKRCFSSKKAPHVINGIQRVNALIATELRQIDVLVRVKLVSSWFLRMSSVFFSTITHYGNRTMNNYHASSLTILHRNADFLM